MAWLTAWVRLVAADDAIDVATRAVTRVASQRKRLRGPELKVAVRHEAARLLAQSIAAVPSNLAPRPTSKAPIVELAWHVYAPQPAGDESRRTEDPRDPRDPREQTTTGRLEIALERLAPYERLACVSYFLDGVSTDAIASLLGVSRELAVTILEGAAPSIAAAVGDSAIPDFSAATDEVEVVTL